MKHFFAGILLMAFLPAMGQQQTAVTNLVDNKGDKLYTTIYLNPGKENIILLHGGPGFPSDLGDVVMMLKDDYQVITFHQRGTGLSPCSSKDYSMVAYISDVEAIRQFYKLNKFHLWGHSWGGLYAQIYADKHPENLISLFLCCPGSGTNVQWKQTEKEVLQLNRSKTTFWQWSMMGWNSLGGAMGSNNAYRRLFRRVMKNYNDGFMATDIDYDFSNLRAEAINKTRKAIVKYPLLRQQTNTGYKVTIIYGDQDIYQQSKHFVEQRFPTAKIINISSSGHMPWLHNPQEYKNVLLAHYKN